MHWSSLDNSPDPLGGRAFFLEVVLVKKSDNKNFLANKATSQGTYPSIPPHKLSNHDIALILRHVGFSYSEVIEYYTARQNDNNVVPFAR